MVNRPFLIFMASETVTSASPTNSHERKSRWSSSFEGRSPFNLLNYSHEKGGVKEGKARLRSLTTPCFNCIKIERKLTSQPDSKGLADHVPSSFISLTTSFSSIFAPNGNEFPESVPVATCLKSSTSWNAELASRRPLVHRSAVSGAVGCSLEQVYERSVFLRRHRTPV